MRKTLLFAVALLIGSWAAMAQIAAFPYTQDFEGGLAGWTIVDQDGDGYNWEVDNSSDYAHGGTGYIHSDSYNSEAYELTPDNYLISPAIELPDEEGFLLEYYVGAYDDYYYAEHLSVYVSASNDPATIAASTANESYTLSGADYEKHTINLNDYAGQTVYIVFRHHNCTDQWQVILDDIVVRQAGAPMITLGGVNSTQVGVDAMFHVTLTEGLTPTYAWSSVMATAGQATIDDQGDTAVITYTAGGIDTVTVVATNALGSATATRTVTVIDCGTAEALPWTASLASDADLQCWNFVDGDNNGRNWSRSSGNSGAYLGSRGGDNWAITPLVQMPSDAEGTILEWRVRGYSNNKYEVWVSPTGGANIEDFTDSLFGETYTNNSYASRTLDLSGYSGQAIRIAFRHTHTASGSNNAMRLQNIGVRQTTAPVITITGPTSVDAGANGNFAIVVSEGSLTGISYSWSSLMASAGQATIGATDSTAVITYSAGGDDTITATATNAYGTATATYAVHVRECNPIDELPWAADFSSSSAIECWTLIDNDNNNHNWSRGGNGGNAYLSSRGTDDWAVTPAITMPGNADGAIVEWSVRGFTGCSYQVWVAPDGGANVADFTDSLFAESYSSSNNYASRSADLSSYAGQTIRIAFRHTGSGSSSNNMRLRGVGVRITGAPVITIDGPALVDKDSTNSFAIVLTEGILDGIGYTWSSAMADAGLADITATDSTMTIVYTAGGTDIITATATNGLGSGSATHTVFVRDCSGISTFPWNEGFEQAGMLACWTMVDADNDGYNWSHATTSGYARNGTGYMMSASYEDAELYPDNYLISPAIILPDEDGFIAEYYVGAYSASYYAEHISVYVATSTDVTAIAASTPAESYTLSGADYVKHTISLNDYAGQTIYLVFRHHQSSDQWYLHLDDVAVRRTMAPVVSIVGDVNANVGINATYTAHLDEGSTENLAYSWTSSMADAGLATMVNNDSSIVLNYSTIGHDTITVTVTNSFGTATKTIVVTVIDINPVVAFPYNTGFDSTDTDNAFWQLVGGASANRWTIGTATQNGGTSALYITNNGSSYAYNSSNSAYAYAYRALSLDAGEYSYSYDWKCVGEMLTSAYDYLRVFLAPSSFTPTGNNATTGLTASALPIGFIPLDGGTVLVDQSEWTTMVGTVSITTPGLYKLVFYWTNDATSSNGVPAAVDNVSFNINSCPAPTALTVTNVGAHTMDVSWTAMGTETEWAVTANGVTTIVNTASYSVTGLESATSYTIKVRAVCGAGDTSVASSVTGRTECEGGNCEFTVEMADSYGDGWNGSAGITVMQGGSTIDMVKLSSGNYGSQTVTTCLGQPITLSWTSGTFDYEASFSIVNANGIEVYAVDDCSGLTSGEVFLTFDATCHADGEEPGPEPETCNVPTNLHTVNVTTTVASVDWTAGGTESAWQLEVNGTVYSASGHPYTLANLSAGTQYSVRVRAVCGDSLYSEWSTALTFSTENETPVPPDGIDGVDAVPFALYPNPASSVVYVEVDGSAWISLLDLNGRELLRTDKPSFDVTALPQGTYFVRVTTTDGSAVRKLVVR